MVCVHGTAGFLASSARQGAPGLFFVSSPESITLTGSQDLLPLQATWVSPLFCPSPQCPAHCVHISWARKLFGLLSKHLTLHRAQEPWAAPPCHWRHPTDADNSATYLPAKGRHFRTAVILFYSSKEEKPSLDGEVKVLLQCLEQQMVSSVYAEKTGMNQRGSTD